MATPAPRTSKADILALGFGTSVAMWAVAYILRLPAIAAPAAVTTGGLCAAAAIGGYFAGRLSRRGWLGGLWTGLLSGGLNLLIVLSAISERLQPGATDYVDATTIILPALGSVVATVVLCILGAAFGNTRRARAAELPNWTAAFSKVAATATFILIIAGGLVTSNRAGLAVPDWPNSFGHNMFLLPLSRLDDPAVFLEHAHRLWAVLVGLTVLTLAIHLSRAAVSRGVKLAAWVALLLVCIQAVLGGLRVEDKLTWVAMIHGVLAQVIFAIVAGIATATSTQWAAAAATKRYPSAGTDRALPIALVALLLVQIAIGADLRHLHDADRVMLHITVAVLALALAIFTGVRIWGMHADLRALRRRGVGLMHLTVVQILLGFAALGVGALSAVQPSFVQALFITLHQANGAGLLAWSVIVMLWNRKLLWPGVEDLAQKAA